MEVRATHHQDSAQDFIRLYFMNQSATFTRSKYSYIRFGFINKPIGSPEKKELEEGLKQKASMGRT